MKSITIELDDETADEFEDTRRVIWAVRRGPMPDNTCVVAILLASFWNKVGNK